MSTAAIIKGPSDRSQSREELWDIILVDLPLQEQEVVHVIMSRADVVVGAPGRCKGFNNQAALNILKHGISSRAITPLSHFLGVPRGKMALILDLHRTTAKRRADKDQLLPVHAAENVLRVLELEEMANDTFESEEAAHGWLRRPHPMLDGESPLESAKSSYGARRVRDILVAIRHGGVV